jgi:uncharacterized membrane protein
MSSNADMLLQQKYKSMIGLGSISSISNNTILPQLSIINNLVISNNSLLNNIS